MFEEKIIWHEITTRPLTEGEPGKARKLIEDAPTVAAVPVSKILALRDALYEADAVTMRGLRNLNMLLAKYEGGKEK